MKIKHDVGLSWGKIINVVGQAGTVQGIYNSVSLFFILYFTSIKPEIGMPLWAYMLLVGLALGFMLWFILRVGISGYYRFFSQESGLDRVEEKVNKIMEHLKIEASK